MPLSELERQVLETLCSESKKWVCGVPFQHLHVSNVSPRAIGKALSLLNAKALVVPIGVHHNNQSWKPTTQGKAALAAGGAS